MKDNKLTTYCSILTLYLIIGFFLNTNLRIMASTFYCLLSTFYYYSEKKNTLNTQDIYFVVCLILAGFGCFSALWRDTPLGVSIETTASTLLLISFILSLKNPNQYLFLGRKWVIILGIILMLFLILYFTNHFLPFISDTNVPISLLLVFVVGFLFIISLTRAVNNHEYFLHFFGICSIIASCTVAAFSIYHSKFPRHTYLEDAFAMVGICLLTIGMLRSDSTKIPFENHQNLSLSQFLKKMFS